MTRYRVLAACLLLASWPASAPAGADTPRNIILLISDGCGFNHVAAADLYEHGRLGDQVYEQFPVRLAVATQPAGRPGHDPQAFWRGGKVVTADPTDSAASITAMTTGVKTDNGKLCVDTRGRAIVPLAGRMEAGGRATGVVSSVLFSHATPAGVGVSHPDRDDYSEIARKLLLDSGLDVIMGAGHPRFDRQGKAAEKIKFKYVGGEQIWAELLAGDCGGDADGDGRPDPWSLIQDRAEFQSLQTGPAPARVLGVARVRETLQQERGGEPNAAPFAVPFNENVPTLTEMARGALNVLDDHPGGFFLMVEGGAVDWAAHDNLTGRMLEEQLAFNRMVEAVVDWVESHGGWRENLVIVTADHETGYLTGPEPQDGPPPACRFELPLVSGGPGQAPALAWHLDEHTNAPVPLFARGPGAERLNEAVRGTDPVWGPYLDNTDLGRLLIAIAGREL